ncbi:MAG: class I SAM-dependent methyltransferase [Lachnospiraceae bacterium]|nr:class I SAM-dependent methyltransferase [Lachnospiraceae bacterium]
MQEQFGKVTVTYDEATTVYDHVSSNDESALEAFADEEHDLRRMEAPDWIELYHFSHLRVNLIEWLPIRETDRMLEFGADTGQLTGGFLEKAKEVVCLEERPDRCRILAKRHSCAENLSVYAGNMWKNLEALPGGFDWIIAPGVLEQAGLWFSGEEPQVQAIQKLKARLNPGGHLVLAADNRLGLKYWAGAANPHNGVYFDNLEGAGCGFTKQELERILEESGLIDVAFYYPYPERWFPVSIYSDRRLPKTGELNRNLRNFEGERLVLFDEEKVYDRLIADGRFPEFSNAFLIVTGTSEGNCPVYVKYSNDRAERWSIRTDILETADGSQVRKVPVSSQAKEHIENMKRREATLARQCAAGGIRANRCELRDGAAYFEFLEGRTFEERLDELRSRRDYAGLAAALQDYRRLLLACLAPELAPFEKSARFIEMFGDPAFAKAYEGAPVNNLDWIFGNLMETAEGMEVIDYEWTFEVQVPVEYLLWRALSLYLHSRTDLQSLGLMAQMGISSHEEQIFAEMEHHFQLWLLQGTVTIDAQYLHTAGRTLRLDDLLDHAGRQRMQVYADTGEGFTEADSWWVDTAPDKEGNIHIRLLLPERTKALRIDPAESSCLVSVKRILGELGGSYTLNYIHNGRELEPQGILYTTDDPQITVPALTEGTRQVYLELTVQELNRDTAFACMNLLNRVRTAERIYNCWPVRLLRRIRHGH